MEALTSKAVVMQLLQRILDQSSALVVSNGTAAQMTIEAGDMNKLCEVALLALRKLDRAAVEPEQTSSGKWSLKDVGINIRADRPADEPPAPSSKELLRAAIAEWDRWSKSRDQSVPFNEVLTHRAEALETIIGAARLVTADEPAATPTDDMIALCIEMEEWLRPEITKEPDRSFFWRLVEVNKRAKSNLLLVPCPRCEGTGKLAPYRVELNGKWSDWISDDCPEQHFRASVPPSVEPSADRQFAGWLNRVSNEFIDVQTRPIKPGNWVPVYFAPSIAEVECRTAQPPSVEPSDAQHVCIDQLYHSGWKGDCIACQRLPVPPSVEPSEDRAELIRRLENISSYDESDAWDVICDAIKELRRPVPPSAGYVLTEAAVRMLVDAAEHAGAKTISFGFFDPDTSLRAIPLFNGIVSETVENLRASITKGAEPPDDDLRADAERWRALIGCARITAMGSAGLDQRRADGYAHVTLNFWTRGEHEKDSYSREWLRTFADIARASATKSARPFTPMDRDALRRKIASDPDVDGEIGVGGSSHETNGGRDA